MWKRSRRCRRRGCGWRSSPAARRDDDARLREQGFAVLRPEPTRGAGGCWVQFVHPKSTGGVLLELSQEAAPEEDE
jgi:hypothetical protein